MSSSVPDGPRRTWRAESEAALGRKARSRECSMPETRTANSTVWHARLSEAPRLAAGLRPRAQHQARNCVLPSVWIRRAQGPDDLGGGVDCAEHRGRLRRCNPERARPLPNIAVKSSMELQGEL